MRSVKPYLEELLPHYPVISSLQNSYLILFILYTLHNLRFWPTMVRWTSSATIRELNNFLAPPPGQAIPSLWNLTGQEKVI